MLRQRERLRPPSPPTIKTLYITFITFSICEPIQFEHPELELVDCSVLRAPPSRMCDRFTGLDPEIQNPFFSSDPGSMAMFRRVCNDLYKRIDKWRFRKEGHFLVVPVACTAGVHRSVSMAEKLASEVSRWKFDYVHLSVQVDHTKLWRSVRLVAEEAARTLYEYNNARARYEDLRYEDHRYEDPRYKDLRYEYYRYEDPRYKDLRCEEYMARVRFEDLCRQVTPGGDGIIRRKYNRGCVRNIVSE